mmetsp:Transcript_27756/g.54004  ORF Transcript_27756/g.54004 Transcript_27756/m.54004 type:complete len:168 (+) Transcript_27756:145-648(+)
MTLASHPSRLAQLSSAQAAVSGSGVEVATVVATPLLSSTSPWASFLLLLLLLVVVVVVVVVAVVSMIRLPSGPPPVLWLGVVAAGATEVVAAGAGPEGGRKIVLTLSFGVACPLEVPLEASRKDDRAGRAIIGSRLCVEAPSGDMDPEKGERPPTSDAAELGSSTGE